MLDPSLALADPEAAPSVDSFGAAAARLRVLCAEDLERVDRRIVDSLQSPVRLIPEIAERLVKAGGKRLRPLTTLATARMFGCGGAAHVTLASAVELIHGATLLHDDVVDASALRRGLSTANVVWGNKESVLVGDFLFSRAFELMVAVGDLRILDVLSRASGVIAEGEVMQLSTQSNVDATFEMYLAVIEAKTAALFAAAAEAGARAAGAPEASAVALGAYGRDLGIAYQLIDDALDYAGREPALGKQVGDDFRERKMTGPVVFALKAADARERAFWARTIGEGVQRPEDFDEAARIVERRGAIAATLDRAERYAQSALDALACAPDNAWRDALAGLAEASAARAR